MGSESETRRRRAWVSKASANDAWKAKRYAECLDHLDASLGVNGDCDVLHRYRSRAYTLQNWLHLVFLPTYKKVLKDKARGLASKTL